MIGAEIIFIILCLIFSVGIIAHLGAVNEPITDKQTVIILIAIIILACLCLDVGAKSCEPKYFYEGMRVEKEDIDFSEFTMTYDKEKNCYNLERKEK